MNCIEADNVIDLNENRKTKMSQEVMENLIAQLEASKQMYNEALNALYQVRTHNVMLQRQMQAVNARLTELEKQKMQEVEPTHTASEIQIEQLDLAPKPCEAESDGFPDGMTA